MNFQSLLESIDCSSGKITIINPLFLKAQYNPTRFKHWKDLHNGAEKDVLNMLYSPHFINFL